MVPTNFGENEDDRRNMSLQIYWGVQSLEESLLNVDISLLHIATWLYI
jgi:hypothetical protein